MMWIVLIVPSQSASLGSRISTKLMFLCFASAIAPDVKPSLETITPFSMLVSSTVVIKLLTTFRVTLFCQYLHSIAVLTVCNPLDCLVSTSIWYQLPDFP